jgi:hypothetical protein
MNNQLLKDFFTRCLDNTVPQEKYERLGILWFAKKCFPEQFSSNFSPKIHYPMAKVFLALYDPRKTSRTERQAYALIHREAAKTTICTFLFPLYNIYLKGMVSYVRFEAPGWEGSDRHDYDILPVTLGEDFILIVSETATAAEEFATNIKTQVEERLDLANIFGDKHPSAIQTDFETTRKGDGLWRKNAFITSDKTIVRGIGAGQQVRGRNIRNKRPTLGLSDDIYSEKNVATEYGRGKTNTWFFKAYINSLDKIKGKVMSVGTAVHHDTIFTGFQKSELWSGIEVPIIDIAKLQKIVSEKCTRTEETIAIPSKEECFRIQAQEAIYKDMSWPDRYDLHYILTLYKQCYEDKNLHYFYAEYMNEPVAPENSKYTLSNFKFVEMNVIKTNKNEDVLTFTEDNMTWFGYPRLTIGIDGASAESKNADDTALVQVGIATFTAMIPGTNQIVKKTIPFVFDARGGHYDEYDNPEKYKKGFIDEADRMQRQARNICTAFEVSGQQAMQYREMCRAFKERGLNMNVVEAKPSPDMKKEQRINSVLSPIVGLYNTIYINSRAPKGRLIMSQLCTLGAAKHDDYADATAIAFSYVVPNNQEYHATMSSDINRPMSLTNLLYHNRESRKGLTLKEKLKKQQSPWVVM